MRHDVRVGLQRQPELHPGLRVLDAAVAPYRDYTPELRGSV